MMINPGTFSILCWIIQFEFHYIFGALGYKWIFHLHNHILPTWIFPVQLHFYIIYLFTICPQFWSRDASYFSTLCMVIVPPQKSFLLIHFLLMYCQYNTSGSHWPKDGLPLEVLHPPIRNKENVTTSHQKYIWNFKRMHTHIYYNCIEDIEWNKWFWVCKHTHTCIDYICFHSRFHFKVIMRYKTNFILHFLI